MYSRDQFADGVADFEAVELIDLVQPALQVRHQLSIHAGDAGMQGDGSAGPVRRLQVRLELCSADLQRAQVVADHPALDLTVGDLLDQASGPALHLPQFFLKFQPVGRVGSSAGGHSRGESGDRLGDRVRVQQIGLQAGQHPRLDAGIGGAAAVVAAAGGRQRAALDARLAAHGRARPTHDHAPAAQAAADQAAEQPGGLALAPWPAARVGLAGGGVAGADGGPETLVDDAKLRRRHDDQPGRIGGAAAPAAGGPLLDEGLAAPDDLARVQPVVDHAVAARGVAGDRAGVPRPARGPGDGLGVEGRGDRARALAGGIGAEDPHNDGRLVLIDLAQAPDRLAGGVVFAAHAVAVAQAAARPARPDDSVEAAPGLGRDALDHQRAHHAADPDMHVGDPALLDRVDRHAQRLEILEDLPALRATPRQPVGVLGDHQVEPAGPGPGHQGAHPRPVGHGLAADRRVLEFPHHHRAQPIGMGPAGAQLVGDAGRRLVVGAEAGVEGGAEGHQRMTTTTAFLSPMLAGQTGPPPLNT